MYLPKTSLIRVGYLNADLNKTGVDNPGWYPLPED